MSAEPEQPSRVRVVREIGRVALGIVALLISAWLLYRGAIGAETVVTLMLGVLGTFGVVDGGIDMVNRRRGD